MTTETEVPSVSADYTRSQWSALSIRDRIRAMNETLDHVEHTPPRKLDFKQHSATESSTISGSNGTINIGRGHLTENSFEDEIQPKRSSVIDIWRKRESMSPSGNAGAEVNVKVIGDCEGGRSDMFFADEKKEEEDDFIENNEEKQRNNFFKNTKSVGLNTTSIHERFKAETLPSLTTSDHPSGATLYTPRQKSQAESPTWKPVVRSNTRIRSSWSSNENHVRPADNATTSNGETPAVKMLDSESAPDSFTSLHVEHSPNISQQKSKSIPWQTFKFSSSSNESKTDVSKGETRVGVSARPSVANIWTEGNAIKFKKKLAPAEDTTGVSKQLIRKDNGSEVKELDGEVLEKPTTFPPPSNRRNQSNQLPRKEVCQGERPSVVDRWLSSESESSFPSEKTRASVEEEPEQVFDEDGVEYRSVTSSVKSVGGVSEIYPNILMRKASGMSSLRQPGSKRWIPLGQRLTKTPSQCTDEHALQETSEGTNGDEVGAWPKHQDHECNGKQRPRSDVEIRIQPVTTASIDASSNGVERSLSSVFKQWQHLATLRDQSQGESEKQTMKMDTHNEKMTINGAPSNFNERGDASRLLSVPTTSPEKNTPLTPTTPVSVTVSSRFPSIVGKMHLRRSKRACEHKMVPSSDFDENFTVSGSSEPQPEERNRKEPKSQALVFDSDNSVVNESKTAMKWHRHSFSLSAPRTFAKTWDQSAHKRDTDYPAHIPKYSRIRQPPLNPSSFKTPSDTDDAASSFSSKSGAVLSSTSSAFAAWCRPGDAPQASPLCTSSPSWKAIRLADFVRRKELIKLGRNHGFRSRTPEGETTSQVVGADDVTPGSKAVDNASIEKQSAVTSPKKSKMMENAIQKFDNIGRESFGNKSELLSKPAGSAFDKTGEDTFLSTYRSLARTRKNLQAERRKQKDLLDSPTSQYPMNLVKNLQAPGNELEHLKLSLPADGSTKPAEAGSLHLSYPDSDWMNRSSKGMSFASSTNIPKQGNNTFLLPPCSDDHGSMTSALGNGHSNFSDEGDMNENYRQIHHDGTDFKYYSGAVSYLKADSNEAKEVHAENSSKDTSVSQCKRLNTQPKRGFRAPSPEIELLKEELRFTTRYNAASRYIESEVSQENRYESHYPPTSKVNSVSKLHSASDSIHGESVKSASFCENLESSPHSVGQSVAATMKKSKSKHRSGSNRRQKVRTYGSSRSNGKSGKGRGASSHPAKRHLQQLPDMASDTFIKENASNIQACRGECETFSLYQVAADLSSEFRALGFDKIAATVSETVKSCIGDRGEQCNDLNPFDDEDIAIELEYMGESIDDEDEDDPHNDFGLCSPMDDAIRLVTSGEHVVGRCGPTCFIENKEYNNMSPYKQVADV